MASGAAAVDWLCNPDAKVSCHYLIDVDGSIVQMVDENDRAWHAGVSSWHDEIDLNSASIGIEIQNAGHAAGCPAFPLQQMLRVAALCRDIMARNGFGAAQVVAHSDIAPGRKIDPGEAFDWDWLYGQGVGLGARVHSVPAATALKLGDTGFLVEKLQKDFAAFGYGINLTSQFDDRTRLVVEAFQRRFRRNRVDGVADPETIQVLQRLLASQPLV